VRTMNRDEVMKVWRLDNCDNFVGKREELRFHAFSDSEPVERALDGSDITGALMTVRAREFWICGRWDN